MEGIAEWGSDGRLERLVVVVPVRMPTWNCLLGMEPWKRKECRDLLHKLTSLSLTTVPGWPILKDSALRQLWMRSLAKAYLRTTARKKSAKSETDKGKLRRKRRKGRRSRCGSSELARLLAGRAAKVAAAKVKKPPRG